MMHKQGGPPAGLTKRGAATRSRIVEGAADLVLRNGVAGTSLDEIMTEIGVSKSQLYHYFADKDAIVAEVIRLQVRKVLAAQSPQLGSIDSMETLRQWCDVIIHLTQLHGTNGGCPIGSLASELSERSEGARSMLVDGFGSWRSQIEAGLRKMRDRGELTETANPEELAIAILGAVQGGLLLAKTMRSVRPVQLALDMALALVERHLTPAPPSSQQPQEPRATSSQTQAAS
jgi:AcrR family transcriptional regulator